MVYTVKCSLLIFSGTAEIIFGLDACLFDLLCFLTWLFTSGFGAPNLNDLILKIKKSVDFYQLFYIRLKMKFADKGIQQLKAQDFNIFRTAIDISIKTIFGLTLRSIS